MAYVSNPYIWCSAGVWLVFFFAGANYLRNATRLSQLIDERHPDLWQRAYPNRSNNYYLAFGRGRALGWMVLFDWGLSGSTDDPEFKQILSIVRWNAAACLTTFTLALVLIAKADVSIHSPT